MSRVFAEAYSEAYDSLYVDKDYSAECDLVEDIFRRFASAPAVSVLDLGCGTGNHSIPLARRGYQLTGVDRSLEMLHRARDKARSAGVDIDWVQGDVRTLEAAKSFDAVLMMFAVLSYQVGNDDVRDALRTVRRHLTDGGLAIFDVWYGPAVLMDVPGNREKAVTTPSGQLTRRASADLDTRRHLCTVHYELLREDAANPLAAEDHVVRYFFPMEIELLLEQADLELLSLSPFGQLNAPLDESSRDALVVARAR